ncbi:hypothetical protein ACJMK2_032912 [Sinanodonta woodiana]|uniref:carbonyl reductase (NADPH) n=1 Tax=Sinanodonta woodiana TaxID=1069815 RepID=A0ABD3X3T3_SINWO
MTQRRGKICTQLVTGANKGIGFAIVRGLCKQFDGDVILTARDEDRGMRAVKDLMKEGLNPLFHKLDISNQTSIQTLKAFLHKHYGGLDVLVNNAAIGSSLFANQAVKTLQVNFWGTLAVYNQLFPLLRPRARVVTLSSRASTWTYCRCSDVIKDRIRNPNITMEQLKELIREFEESAHSDTLEEKGWVKFAYGVSKIGVRLMSYIQGRDMTKETKKADILVNACCPGFVNTDMNDHKGTKTIDEGAETPLYLALLPSDVKSPKGEFIEEKNVTQWPN